MKRVILSLLMAGVMLFASACGSSAPSTSKASQLSSQYSFYGASVKSIQSGMSITPEQADEVFLILVKCGMNKEISYVIGTSPNYTVDFGKVGDGVTNYNVTLNNGVVSEVSEGGKVLYPASKVASAAAASKAEAKKAKNTAVAIDGQISDILSKSEQSTQILQKACSAFSDGGGSTLDLYNIAKQAKDNQDSYFSALSDLRDKNNKEYISACQSYVVNSQGVADDLMKYLDKNELKYASEATDAIKLSSTYSAKVVTERTNYLSSQGLSDSEISDILSSGSSSSGSSSTK